MGRKFFKVVFFTILSATLLLVGCSDFDEMKGNRMLLQVENLMEQGHELQAEKALADLIKKYPATQAGKKASKRLAQLVRQREIRQREPFAKVLDSYQQVLNGYFSMYAEYPRSIARLDESDYFFDSTYLEEITPEGYRVYLWLESNGNGYQVWCVTDNLQRGYSIKPRSQQVEPFDRDETLAGIAERFQSVASGRKLIALQQQN